MNYLAFTPDGMNLAVTNDDGSVAFRDVASGKSSAEIFGPAPGPSAVWRSRPTAGCWRRGAPITASRSGTWRRCAGERSCSEVAGRSTVWCSRPTAVLWPPPAPMGRQSYGTSRQGRTSEPWTRRRALSGQSSVWHTRPTGEFSRRRARSRVSHFGTPRRGVGWRPMVGCEPGRDDAGILARWRDARLGHGRRQDRALGRWRQPATIGLAWPLRSGGVFGFLPRRQDSGLGGK